MSESRHTGAIAGAFSKIVTSQPPRNDEIAAASPPMICERDTTVRKTLLTKTSSDD